MTSAYNYVFVQSLTFPDVICLIYSSLIHSQTFCHSVILCTITSNTSDISPNSAKWGSFWAFCPLLSFTSCGCEIPLSPQSIHAMLFAYIGSLVYSFSWFILSWFTPILVAYTSSNILRNGFSRESHCFEILYIWQCSSTLTDLYSLLNIVIIFIQNIFYCLIPIAVMRSLWFLITSLWPELILSGSF